MKTLSTTAISILDLAKISQGQTLTDAFAVSKQLAQMAESLGYTRYWFAEHHNFEGIGSAATSVLIGYIAENTKTIRVGSGGIMLPNHAPLAIVEQFGTLETLYPGRIDLGLGRAPGTDQLTMNALRRGVKEADFGELITELEFYFQTPEPHQKIRAVPGNGLHIPLYILGSSLYSAQLAARLGRPYAFAGHFAPTYMMQAFDIYRSMFQPSEHLKEPYIIVGVPVIAAETDEEAKYLATSVQQTFLNLIRGQRKLLSPPVPDIEAVWSRPEKEAVDNMLGLLITGGPKKVKEELNALIARTGADELIITADTYATKDRLRSYELIAQAKFGDSK